MPDEFRSIHSTARVATSYMGKLKGKLESWGRKMDEDLGKMRGKEAASAIEVDENLKKFEKAISNLKKLKQKADNDKSEEKEDSNNYSIIMAEYSKWWKELFIPFSKKFLPLLKEFKTLEEMEKVLKDARQKLNILIKKEAEQKKEVKQEDSSFAYLTNNLSKCNDKPRSRFVIKIKKIAGGKQNGTKNNND